MSERIHEALGAAVAGLVFGTGLLLSGMADPAKVLAFLDVTGRWDPSLAWVMAGAIAVAAPAFAWARRRRVTLLGEPLDLPTATRPTVRLVAGSAAFGVGWGLGGFCPGPALVLVSTGHDRVSVFVTAMLIGMGLHALWERRGVRRSVPPG